MYLYTDTDETVTHAETDAEETSTRVQWCDACATFTTTVCEHPAALKAPATLETIVCSCGFTTCGAIGTFGLPRPIFVADIEPIPSQPQRDRTAVAIKAGN